MNSLTPLFVFRAGFPALMLRACVDLTLLELWLGEAFPLECPGCGGDIRLRGVRRQEPAHFEPEVRKRKKARMRIVTFLQSHYLNQLVDSGRRATVLSFRGLAVNVGYGAGCIVFTAATAVIGRVADGDA